MSGQTFAGPDDPYYLSTRGVDNVSFNKQVAPPLAYFDKGILYELNDGVLYFNGVPLSGGGGSGDVTGPSSSIDEAITRFDGTTGKIIQNSRTTIDDNQDILIMKHDTSGDGLQPILGVDILNANTMLGFYAAPNSADPPATGTYIGYNAGYEANGNCDNDTFVGNFCGTAGNASSRNTGIGSLSLRNITIGQQNCAVGCEALTNVTTGSYLTAVGAEALFTGGINRYATAVGFRSQRTSNNDGSNIPNTSVGAFSMLNLTDGKANNAVGWRALEGGGGTSADGPVYNNMFGCFNGLSARDGFEYNCCFGNSCLNSCEAGKGNVCLGNGSGESFITGSESYNILIGNGTGVNNDNRTIRIGASADNTSVGIGKPTDCYIQGIENRSASLAVSRKQISIDSTGKLYGMALGESNPSAYGYFENFSSPYSIAVSTTPVLLNPTMTFSSTGNWFSNSGGTFTWLGADTVSIKCAIDVSYISPASGIHITSLSVYKNGVVVPGGTRRLFINAPLSGNINMVIPSCATGTTIEVYVNISTSTTTFNIGSISACLSALY